MSRPARLPALRPARGFSLIEAVMSVVIVGGLLVAAMNTLGAGTTAEYTAAERSRALLLAEDLMTEILQQAYEDPAYPPGSFGRGADEAATGDRSLFDDVDDYHGWSASPPQYRDGTPISWAGGFTRSVQVHRVNSGNLNLVVGSDSGVKRIRVTVTRGGKELVVLTGYRTSAWQDPAEIQGAGG